jgi:hypothetical protein
VLRKKKCCPGCGILLLIASDCFSDGELRALRSFWILDPSKKGWDYIPDWEEHKRAVARKFEEYGKRVMSCGSDKMQRALTHWIQ